LTSEPADIADASVLEGKVVGIYFSAHWCPPCKEFTPKLALYYDKLQEAGKKFEVVLVSLDRSASDFDSYRKSMPWVSLPFEVNPPKGISAEISSAKKAALKLKYNVTAIPCLVLLDENGAVIEKNATAKIMGDPEGEKFPYKHWRANADGRQSFVYQQNDAEVEHKFDLQFEKYDVDKSGFIETDELKLVLKALHMKEQEIQLVLQNFDYNKDGKLSRDEFKQLLETQSVASITSLMQIAVGGDADPCVTQLTTFACCCCLCTAGLSCIPLKCYGKCVIEPRMTKQINAAMLAPSKYKIEREQLDQQQATAI
jgi:thiol-disulfide isomerase/thioredoxin